MIISRAIGAVLAAGLLVACERSGDDNAITDGGVDGGRLTDGIANIWVDPDGCQHWYIDDGLEGYMTPRLDRNGIPRCQDTRGAIMLKDGRSVMSDPVVTRP